MLQQFDKTFGFSPGYQPKHPGVYHPANVENHDGQHWDGHRFSSLPKARLTKVVAEEAQVEQHPSCYLKGQDQFLKMSLKIVLTSHYFSKLIFALVGEENYIDSRSIVVRKP